MIAVEMGSEGWAVFGREKNGISDYKMLASHLTEEEAKLFAYSPDLKKLLGEVLAEYHDESVEHRNVGLYGRITLVLREVNVE